MPTKRACSVITSYSIHYTKLYDGPVILGSSRVSALRFIVLNVIGAIPWAILVSGRNNFV